MFPVQGIAQNKGEMTIQRKQDVIQGTVSFQPQENRETHTPMEYTQI